jgi:hypothetical protein
MVAKIVKGTIQFEDKKITFEGPSDFVEIMVSKYTDISKPQANNIANGNSSENRTATTGGERDLIAAKQPRGHHEIVAVLAFALTEAGTSVFTEDDIRRAYIRAGVRPPKVVAQALRDAKNKYEYVELAGKRGQYRLTNHGDRVVRFDLPTRRGDRDE